MNGPHQTPFSIVFIRHLLTPSLLSLDLFFSKVDDVTLQSFLANCPLICPNLKSISINIDTCEVVSSMTTAYLSQAISSYGHLEHLDVSIPVNNVALVHIAKSPTLKKLTLRLDPERSNLHWYQVHLAPDLVTVPFCNVEELSLEVWDLFFITALLRTQHQKLHSLKISLRSQPTFDTVSAFFTVLLSSQRVDCLQSLTFEDNYTGTRSVHQTVMRSDKLRPLTCLRRLRKLDLDLGCWISMDDNDLISLARNWPLLQSLSLSWDVPGHPWMSVQYITFKGLLSLLKCCPGLTDLLLPLDARKVVKTDNTEWEGVVCNSDLTHLYFTDSPITNSQLVAEIIRRHFPSVVEVGAWFHESSMEDYMTHMAEYYSLWAEVDGYLEGKHYPDHDHN